MFDFFEPGRQVTAVTIGIISVAKPAVLPKGRMMDNQETQRQTT
jgi:hypothetical protein